MSFVPCSLYVRCNLFISLCHRVNVVISSVLYALVTCASCMVGGAQEGRHPGQIRVHDAGLIRGTYPTPGVND